MAVLILAGCTEKGYGGYEKDHKIEHKITFDVKKENADWDTKSTENAPKGAIRGDEPGECRTDDDCVLIPVGGSGEASCLGCLAGAGQDAEDKVEAKQIMDSNRNTCEPIVKNFMQKMQDSQGQPPERSNDPTCQYNDAACVSGVCKLVKRSEEEMRAKFEKMRQSQQNSGSIGTAPGGIREPNHGFLFPRRGLEPEQPDPNFFDRRGGHYPNPSINIKREKEFPLYGATAPSPSREMVKSDRDFWQTPY